MRLRFQILTSGARKFFVAVILLLGSSCSPLWAGTDAVAQQLLAIAEQQANIFEDSGNAMRLDVSLTAQQLTPVQGHITWIRAAHDRWRREVILGEFKQVEIRNGEKLYTSRNLPFTPVRVGEALELLQFAGSPDNLVAKKPKQRTENGTELNCLEVKGDSGRGKAFELGGHRYPRRLEFFSNGSKVITAYVNNLSAITFDDALLTPPQGAIERRQCAGMKHAIPVSTPDPLYPKSASQNKLAGDTVVAMTVLTDGSVTDIQLIGRSAQSMDEATLDTLKRWRFKPAMCGTEPVISDIQVVVSFRMN